MSEAKFCSGSRLSGFIQCCGRGGTLLEGEGGRDFGAGGGPLGQFARDFTRPLAVQAGQNIRETPFHPCKSKHFLRFFLIFER